MCICGKQAVIIQRIDVDNVHPTHIQWTTLHHTDTSNKTISNQPTNKAYAECRMPYACIYEGAGAAGR